VINGHPTLLMTPTHESFRTIHPSLQLTPTIRYLQLKLRSFPNLFSGPFFNDSVTSPALNLYALRHAPGALLQGTANFFMDDTESQFLKPDPRALLVEELLDFLRF